MKKLTYRHQFNDNSIWSRSVTYRTTPWNCEREERVSQSAEPTIDKCSKILHQPEESAGKQATEMPNEYGFTAKGETQNRSANTKEENLMQDIEKLIIELGNIRTYRNMVLSYDGKTYSVLGDSEFKKKLRELLPEKEVRKIKTFNKIREIQQFLEINPNIGIDCPDKMKTFLEYVIPFENGLYDARRGKIVPFSAKYPIIYRLKCDYAYHDDKAPYFDRFLETTLSGRKDMIQLLYEIIGVLLLNGRPMKNFFVFAGVPNSGKSLLASWIKSQYPAENCSETPLMKLGERFAIGEIAKKKLNLCMDLPDTEIGVVAVSMIKTLTGDDEVDAEAKFKPIVTTPHDCKFLFGTNFGIRLRDEDDAFWNRVVVLPFTKAIKKEEQDPFLIDHLKEESSVIASRAARACTALINRNFKYTKVPEAEDLVLAWRGEIVENQIATFVDTKCVLCEDPDCFTSVQRLYKSYCEMYGEKAEATSLNKFSKGLKKLFPKSHTKRRVESYENPINGFLGIKLK